MGFVIINNQKVHTSNISSPSSGTFSNVVNSGYNTYSYSMQPQKHTYHILGEDFTIDGMSDTYTSMIIASINILGKPYYDEILKQNINLRRDIVEFIDRKFITLKRDEKIDSVINDKHDKK